MGLFSKLFGRKKKDEEFLSIVYLLRRHRKVDEPKMRAALAGLIQSVFKMDAPPETHVKEVGESGAGLVIEGQPFVVIGVAEPYTTDDPAQITPDLRKQNLLREHKAWLACDWMLPVNDDEDRQVAYRVMGLVMAAVGMLVKADIIAVFDKHTGRLVPYSDNVPDRLTSDLPESVFEDSASPILSSEGLEEGLQKAADEAQSRLPEFVSAFERRKKGAVCGVKAKFEEGDAVEWMWVSVERITDDGFEGRLDNDPEELKRLKAGDRITVKADEIVDWAITDDNGMRGGFSVEVFQRHVESSNSK
jgi:uncharacterized protein YegJ (DUF2314 family)